MIKRLCDKFLFMMLKCRKHCFTSDIEQFRATRKPIFAASSMIDWKYAKIVLMSSCRDIRALRAEAVIGAVHSWDKTCFNCPFLGQWGCRSREDG
jgi:hypothetical protein